MTVVRLYPGSHEELPLAGLYLGLNLHRQAADGDLLIYSNYIASLDGRISLTLDHSQAAEVPESIVNKRDWRLYQELAAQCDVMITSARYFRQLAAGKAQDLLPVGNGPAYADLLAWRQQQGLKPQPDVAILSNSLDIPLSALETLRDRRIIIFTSGKADDAAVQRLQAVGAEVIVAAGSTVQGSNIKEILAAKGFRSGYMIAGPKVHRTLLADRVIDYLFLTTRLRLIGGNDFDTILAGGIGRAVDMQLNALYLDRSESTAQLFAQFALQQ